MNDIAIVDPLTLIGKELREALVAAPGLASRIRFYSTDEAQVGTVTEAGGEAGFVQRLTEGELDDAALVLFCGDAAGDRAARTALPDSVRSIVLSSGATLEDGFPSAAGLNDADWLGRPRLLNPAPAALLLARLLAALRPAAPESLAATVLLPVSEVGQPGIDALFEETRSLLTFSGARKPKLFPARIAFNLLPGKIAGDEIERQVAMLLGAGSPALAVQTAQAGVFHGVTASVLVELAPERSPAELKRLLGRSPDLAVARHADQLGPVETAGEKRILIGDVRAASAGRFWIWAAMDNLTTGGAINALRIAESILGAGPVA